MAIIKFKRGSQSTVLNYTHGKIGEPIVDTENNHLYLGQGEGNAPILITNSGALALEVVTSDTTATADKRYIPDATSSDINISLPSSPLAGNTVGVLDAFNTATTNDIIILGNGEKINSNSSNFKIRHNGSSIELTYINSTIGWKIMSEVGLSGNKLNSEYQSYTSTASQDTFSIDYTPNQDTLEVVIDGSELASSLYTATSGTNVVLDTPLSAGKSVKIGIVAPKTVMSITKEDGSPPTSTTLPLGTLCTISSLNETYILISKTGSDVATWMLVNNVVRTIVQESGSPPTTTTSPLGTLCTITNLNETYILVSKTGSNVATWVLTNNIGKVLVDESDIYGYLEDKFSDLFEKEASKMTLKMHNSPVDNYVLTWDSLLSKFVWSPPSSGGDSLLTYTNTYESAASWTVNHGLNTYSNNVQCWDHLNNLLTDNLTIQQNTVNQLTVTHTAGNKAGYVVIISTADSSSDWDFGTVESVGDIDLVDDTILVTQEFYNSLSTGDDVMMTADVFPEVVMDTDDSPLDNETIYYAILVIDTDNYYIQIARTQSEAVLGTNIDFTTTGSGITVYAGDLEEGVSGSGDSSLWSLSHNLNNDYLLVSIWNNLNVNDIYKLWPDDILKSDSNTLQVDWDGININGYATIFGLSNELSGQYTSSQTANTQWTIEHSLNTEEIIVQCWNGEGYFIHPNYIERVDSDNILIDFGSQSVNGLVCIGSTDMGISGGGSYYETFTSATSWVVDHNLDSQNIIVQVWSSDRVVSEYSTTINSDNQIVVDFDGNSVAGNVIVLKIS